MKNFLILFTILDDSINILLIFSHSLFFSLFLLRVQIIIFLFGWRLAITILILWFLSDFLLFLFDFL